MTFDDLTPPYATIVADPPWTYDGFASDPSSSSDRKGDAVRAKPMPYSTMSVDDIEALPVKDLASSDARLFLWTTNKYLPSAFGVAKAWGFDYVQTVVWHKTGNPSPFGGSVAPNHAEFLLVARRGSPPILERWATSVVASNPPQRGHSFKPPVFLDLVEQVSPGPYVELFARSPRLGWDAWGYGYEQVS